LGLLLDRLGDAQSHFRKLAPDIRHLRLEVNKLQMDLGHSRSSPPTSALRQPRVEVALQKWQSIILAPDVLQSYPQGVVLHLAVAALLLYKLKLGDILLERLDPGEPQLDVRAQ
jgi:hypothetical protein